MPPLTYDEENIKTVIDKVVKRTFRMDFPWDWSAGVAMYGVSRAYECTLNEEYLDALIQWMDKQLEEGIPRLTVNAVSIGHTLITLYEHTQNQIYLDTAIQMAEHLKHDAVRFDDGIFQHTVSQNYDFPEQAWVDTMFMAGYFLIRMGAILGKDDYMEDGLRQYHGHEKFLQDPVSHLYYHGWDNIGQNHMSGVYWARGNSWAAYTMSKALKDVPVSHSSYMKIHDSLRDQLSSLVRLQSDTGLWHTVLTNSSSYLETSGSAGIAAALVHFNEAIGSPLYNPYIQKAIKGVMEMISEDGTVHGVSAGTAVMKDEGGYMTTPNYRIQGWGQGLALVFLSSLINNSKLR